MAVRLLTDLKRRWGNPEYRIFCEQPKIGNKRRQIGFHKIFALGSILDPRVKKLYFIKNEAEREKIKTALKAEMHRAVDHNMLGVKASLPSTSDETTAVSGVDDEDDDDDSRTKKVEKTPSLWAILASNNNSNHSSDVTSIDSIVNDEFEYYWKEREIHGDKGNPLTWWNVNKSRFPIISVVARIYLAVPATSASSERIFSKGEQVITKRRCRLGPERAGMLIWLVGFIKQQDRMIRLSDEDETDVVYEDESD